jgi:hypothetical protein
MTESMLRIIAMRLRFVGMAAGLLGIAAVCVLRYV